MTNTRRAQLTIGANALASVDLIDRLGTDGAVALLMEETARCRSNGVTTWQGYRSLRRVGSSVSLGGREKKAVFIALKEGGLV